MGIESYRELRVWNLAMDLADACHCAARDLPTSERFGLSSQICGAAGSVPANIAEGYGRRSLGDYLRHLRIANGSLKELETHLLLAQRLGLLEEGTMSGLLRLTDQLGRMLTVLIRKLAQTRGH
jgi:four helix bundle protein